MSWTLDGQALVPLLTLAKRRCSAWTWIETLTATATKAKRLVLRIQSKTVVLDRQLQKALPLES